VREGHDSGPAPADDGQVDDGVVLPGDRAQALYRRLREVVLLDVALADLEAEIGFVPPAGDGLVARVASAFALPEGDWLFPSARDWPAALTRGVALERFAHQMFGSSEDPTKGRNLPGQAGSRERRVASPSSPAATHLPHAVGLAYAARLRGEALHVAALFEGREVDAADFHTGVNFAGVFDVPVLFLCVTPGEPSAAEAGVAYGVEATRVDGTDASAVVQAVEEARLGGGPRILDLVVGPGAGGGIDRLRAHLEGRQLWSEEDEASLRAALRSRLADALRAARSAGPPAPDTLTEDVFA
jgi:pyruvate dehydrogenase E1 component alpha subunit